MIKKYSLVLLALLTAFTLVGCDGKSMTDSEKVREIRDSITFDSFEVNEDVTIPDIEAEDSTINWVSSNENYLTSNGVVTIPTFQEGNKEVSLTVTITLGDAVVNKVFTFTVIAEERPENVELNTDETDSLSMNFQYQNTDFITDGVGEVTLVRCVDGDTAFFTEGGDSFSVRFLGINTPESTAKFEPWGKAASDFTCDKLENATTIVLQADPEAGRMDSYGTRWLAWVWYDGRLLNLELVEQAYSKASGSLNTYYGQLLFDVNLNVQFSERRVWGETDPDFDYTLEGIQLTLEELVTNHEEYYSKKVVITGIVTRKLGGAAYVQQGEYGIYVYNREWAPDLTIGNEVLLSGITVTYYPDLETGALQVSGYRTQDKYSEVLSRDNVVTPKTITIPEIEDKHIGSLLKLEHLTVSSIFVGVDSFTVTAEDTLGNTITIRKHENSPDDIGAELCQDGTTFTIVAPLSRYGSNYQLILTSLDDVTIE
jgi:micrococcal nuclease